MKFYVLKGILFTSYKMAWYEVSNNAQYSNEFPACPDCGGAIGMLKWLPPFNVTIKQPKYLGDLVYGAGGPDLLVSEKFKQAYDKEGISGIKEIFPVEVKKMGTKPIEKCTSVPSLFGVYLKHSKTRVLFEEMGIVWDSEPSTNYCRTCGPGGGGEKNGYIESWKKVVIDESSWDGEDLFFPINFHGQMVLSEKGADFFRRNQFRNAFVIECDDAGYDFSKGCMEQHKKWFGDFIK